MSAWYFPSSQHAGTEIFFDQTCREDLRDKWDKGVQANSILSTVTLSMHQDTVPFILF